MTPSPTLGPEALYAQLGRLVESLPDLTSGSSPSNDVRMWLGRVDAVLNKTGDIGDRAAFRAACSQLDYEFHRDVAASNIANILYRALAAAEMRAPAASQGAFIPAGNAFDALAAISKVFASAKTDLLIVDPYMDERLLTDFIGLATEGVSLRLLSDAAKPAFKPAVDRWVSQHAGRRPLAAKKAAVRTLHDRLILVDHADAWVLTQSFNAFASRSPASIVRSDLETASLKVSAYEAIWATAIPL